MYYSWEPSKGSRHIATTGRHTHGLVKKAEAPEDAAI